MKIVRLRGNMGEDENQGKPKKEADKVFISAQRIPFSVVKGDGGVIRRYDGTEKKSTDVMVLLESGVVVAVPKQVFRGRVAFQFGKRKNKLLLVCAWCGKSMGEVESKMEGVSHGMCKECFDRVTSELSTEKD